MKNIDFCVDYMLSSFSSGQDALFLNPVISVYPDPAPGEIGSETLVAAERCDDLSF